MKQKKSLNTLAFLFCILIVVVIATHLIPAGEFQREMSGGRSVVLPGTFSFVDNPGATFFDILLAMPNGLVNAVNLIMAFLFVTGAVEVVSSTGAINVGISRVVKKFGLKRGNLILIILFYIFSALGCWLGWIENSLPFYPIAISIAVALGYDPIVGVAISFGGAISGFLCGPTNPSTVAVAHNIAGLPLFSGMWFRVIMWLVLPLVFLVYILHYAKKIQRDPAKSYMYGIESKVEKFDMEKFDAVPFTTTHGLVLAELAIGMGIFVYGAIRLGWGYPQMCGVFIGIAIAAGFTARLGTDNMVNAFVRGASSMTNAVMIISLAYGISWILTKAQVLDTLVYFFSAPLEGRPPLLAAIGAFIAVLLINLVIPSGSAKAAIVMPIIFPIADLVGLSAQCAVLCFQFGDAITNMCTPLYGTMLLVLSFGGVPLSKWEKFILPLCGILTVLAIPILLIAVSIGYM